jgi:hypothetical protein
MVGTVAGEPMQTTGMDPKGWGKDTKEKEKAADRMWDGH